MLPRTRLHARVAQVQRLWEVVWCGARVEGRQRVFTRCLRAATAHVEQLFRVGSREGMVEVVVVWLQTVVTLVVIPWKGTRQDGTHCD